MITIELPWPDKRLSPNARVHWREKADAVCIARTHGFWTMNEQRLKEAMRGIYQASYTFYPPDKRRRDIDNVHSSMKAAMDGICSALNMDDSRIKRTVLEWGEVVRGGKVVLRLEEME